MRFGEILGFSSTEYRTKISAYDYSFHTLALNIYQKRRAIAASTTSAVTSVLAATVTGGMALAGTAFAGRNINVEKRKLTLLEEEWERRGQDPLPKRHIKDTLIPVVIAGAIGAFAFSVDLAISNQAAASLYTGQDFNGHAIGAYYTAIERGASSAGNMINKRIAGRSRDDGHYEYEYRREKHDDYHSSYDDRDYYDNRSGSHYDNYDKYDPYGRR